MSTKRDLVEAHGYNRRRLITAFVSGAPGGREVEPVRQGRTIIGGVVLSVLIVAGAAVSGFLQQPPPDDWDQQSVVIGKQSGSRFFAFEGRLYPVINPTSARLLLGEDTEPVSIDDDVIAERDLGPAIGISGAPEVLPMTSQLVEQGWTACTNDSSGIRLTLGQPGVSEAVSGEALLVRSDSERWLLVDGRRHAVGEDEQAERVLRRLGLADREPVAVPGLWLSLFEESSPAAVPDFALTGRQVDTGVPGLEVAGTPVELPTGTYVLAPDGDLAPTTEFAHLVLTSNLAAQSYESGEVDTLDIESDPAQAAYPADWPEDAVSPYTDPADPCIRMDVAENTAPVLSLAVADDTAHAEGSEVERQVEPGAGAVIRATSGNVLDSGNVYLVDSGGTAFPVGERADGAELDILGYQEYAPRPVPQPWLGVLGIGPTLSRTASAQQPVVPGQVS